MYSCFADHLLLWKMVVSDRPHVLSTVRALQPHWAVVGFSSAVGGLLGSSSNEAVGSLWVLEVKYMNKGGEEELWQHG